MPMINAKKVHISSIENLLVIDFQTGDSFKIVIASSVFVVLSQLIGTTNWDTEQETRRRDDEELEIDLRELDWDISSSGGDLGENRPHIVRLYAIQLAIIPYQYET